MKEYTPLDSLKGIGEKTKQIFCRAGIESVGDLLHYFPRVYDTLKEPTAISEVTEDEVQAVCASLEGEPRTVYARARQTTTGLLREGEAYLYVIWYHMPYMKNALKRGSRYVFRGRVTRRSGRLMMEQPAVYTAEDYERARKALQPVYPLCEGLTNKMLQKAIRQALDDPELTEEYLPQEIRKSLGLADYAFALEQIHFPKDRKTLVFARHRLVFDEFYTFLLAVQSLREDRAEKPAAFPMKEPEGLDALAARLDFQLTRAQERVWREIRADLASDRACARLIQGDVGSGKTILAFLAMIFTAENGFQSALMVPTEVLAVQHFHALTELLDKLGLPFHAELLTGSLTAKQKREALERIKTGEADFAVGTHALIQDKVSFDRLALVITDEQHRFGVRQREALGEKGGLPHTLVMSATPIPRTLAVILYGDLDISVVDELPAHRLPIKNCVVDTRYRQKAWEFIKKEADKGHQAYVICPMVEESEGMEAENVQDYARRIAEALPAWIQVGILHGRMKPREKNEIMDRFLKNEIQVLVSTTVVEVGVNVPNATVMMVENAERFGLAQLHQLRGRVGRGKDQSYCIMVHSTDSRRIRERLEILNHSNDGFYIAEEDLKLRGPGDLFGVRQSGIAGFKIGDVFQDAGILAEAKKAVESCPVEPQMREKACRYWNLNKDKLNL